MESSLWGALATVFLLNLVLSGDNAVVIGLAAKNLGEKARRRAILLGGGLAVAIRLVLTLPASYLLHLPLVRGGGGLLLGWVAYRLLTGDEGGSETEEAASVGQAVRLIVIADATMSLDNVLAVAAVAEDKPHHLLVMIVGLALSIPIVLGGGEIVARLMSRLPILSWIGGAILAYTAGELIAEDEIAERVIGGLPHRGIVISALMVLLIVGTALFQVRRRGSTAHGRVDSMASV